MSRLTVREQALHDVFEDMARVHLDHRAHSPAGQVIVLRANGKKVRVIARGAPGNNRGTIHLDLATRERLGAKLGDEIDLQITRAVWWDNLAWAWNATNAMPRIAARLAVLSVTLGGLGLILGIVSLIRYTLGENMGYFGIA